MTPSRMRSRHAFVLVVAVLAALLAPARGHVRQGSSPRRDQAVVTSSNDLGPTLAAAIDQSRTETGITAPRVPLPFAVAVCAAVALVLGARRDRSATVHRHIFGATRFAVARRAPPLASLAA